MELVFLWAMMGVVVALVAKSKGRDPGPWFFYGALLWPVALTHAIVLKGGEVPPPTIRPIGNTVRQSPTAPPVSDLDRGTLEVAAAWCAEGRSFTMLDAKEEARLRQMEGAAKAGASQQSATPAPEKERPPMEATPFRLAAFPAANWTPPPNDR